MPKRKPIGTKMTPTQQAEHEAWKKGFLERSAKRRERSVLVEGGSGSIPVSLINAALKRARLGRKTELVAVDIQGFDEQEILRKTGLKALPKGLDLYTGPAACALMEKAPNSVKAIRAVNLLNSMVGQRVLTRRGLRPAEEVFLEEAQRTLAPGGLLFLTNDKYNELWLSMATRHYGFKPFSKHELTAKECRTSPDASVRRRETVEGRMELIRYWFGEKYWEHPNYKKDVAYLLKTGVFKTVDDFAKPVVYIFRKPYTAADLERLKKKQTKE